MRLSLPLLLLLAMLPLQAAQLDANRAVAPTAANTPVAGKSVRDPMRPPAFALQKYRQEKQKQAAAGPRKPAPKQEPLRLHSILFSSLRRRAIINDRLLAVGDRIDGAKLVAIERDRVRLSRQGRKIVLKLGTDRLEMKKTRTR